MTDRFGQKRHAFLANLGEQLVCRLGEQTTFIVSQRIGDRVERDAGAVEIAEDVTRFRAGVIFRPRGEFESKGRSNFFLFIDRPALAAGDPLEAEWVNGKRGAARLTD